MQLNHSEFSQFNPLNLPDSGLYWIVVDRIQVEAVVEDNLGTVGGWPTGEVQRYMVLSELEVSVDNDFTLASVNAELFGEITDLDTIIAYTEFCSPIAPDHLKLNS